MRFYLIGGFGNLLFQALAYNTLQKEKDVVLTSVLINRNIITRLINWKIHENLSSVLFPKEKIESKISLLTMVDLLCLFVSKLISKPVLKRCWISNSTQIKQNYKAVMGYFQDKDIFRELQDSIPELRNKFDNFLKKEKKTEFVIHFRGTDSVLAKKSDVYYYKVLEKILTNNQSFTVVTDDFTEAQKVFSSYGTYSKNDTFNDFLIMLNASVLVCASSTLSWWAALLTKNANEIYIPLKMKEILPEIKNANTHYV